MYRVHVTRLFLSYGAALLSLAFVVTVSPQQLQAETLFSVLSKTYSANPTLNAQRASTRATDEGVPQALSGYRPSISASADYGFNENHTRSLGSTSSSTRPGGVSITLSQPVFSGFRTQNNTKAAEAQVLASREALRNTEQNILLQAVEAYMNVLRDSAIIRLNSQNIVFIREQLRASEERFNVGEGTRTDVAQSRARLSQAQSQLNLSQANLASSQAIYRQITGMEPRNLGKASPASKGLPATLDSALAIALSEHPAIHSSRYAVNAASFQVKSTEGQLLPTVTLEGSVSRRWEPSSVVNSQDSASVVGRLNVPIYQAGSVSSQVRQTKEILGQRRIELDATREQVRAAVVSAFGSLQASRASLIAAGEQVRAANIALEGVQEERRVGQRTTLDVLNSQQELLNAQVNRVTAERDLVVASYSLLSAIGRLTAQQLGLRVDLYQPEQHYRAVRDKWYGIRTPDGR
jgi:outer membrane protein